MKIQVFRLFQSLCVVGEMLSSMLPAELLEKLNLKLTGFEEAQMEYLSRVANIQ
jgi:hypothetical protein